MPYEEDQREFTETQVVAETVALPFLEAGTPSWSVPCLVWGMGVRVRGWGGGATALPNSGKTVGKIRAKQEECVKFRANQPLCPPP